MIAPISGNNYASQPSTGVQNPQQNFSTLLQQMQSGQVPSQTTSQTQGGTPAQHIVDGTTSSQTVLQGGTPAQHVIDGSASSQHAHRRHHTGDGSQTDDDSDSGTTSSFGQLGQPVQATTASSAQQAYGSLQQDLQQVALNSDLLNAQTAFLQDSVLSVTA
jgi:hypothetical protein